MRYMFTRAVVVPPPRKSFILKTTSKITWCTVPSHQAGSWYRVSAPTKLARIIVGERCPPRATGIGRPALPGTALCRPR